MNTQKPYLDSAYNKALIEYRKQKSVIESQILSPEEYQRKIKALAKKLGV